MAPPRRTQVDGGLEPLLEPEDLAIGDHLGDDPAGFRLSNVKQLSETMIGAPALPKNDLDMTKSSSANAVATATNP